MSSLIDKAKEKLNIGSPSSSEEQHPMSGSNLPKTYKAAVVEKAEAPFTVKELPLQLPKHGEILMKVLACGVCGTDVPVINGHFGAKFPHVTGHEMIGDIAAVPDTEDHWKVGQRVGGAWHGGHCGFCTPCKRGVFVCCEDGEMNGVTRHGGYAEYVLLRREAVVSVPTDVDPAAYAPILCAGITVFNSLRNQGIKQGAVVAVQGLGGLGHLALQFASKMGYKVVALSSSASKKEEATKLGAHFFVDQSSENAIEALQKLGGAACIICTAGKPDIISPLTEGLAVGGTVLILSPTGPTPVNPQHLIMKQTRVAGWPSGSSIDSEEAIDFAKTFGVNCMIEKFPLENVQEAYDKMIHNKVRFRSVLVME